MATTWGSGARPSRARRAARRRAAVIPSRSHSTGSAWPTDQAVHQLVIGGKSSSRRSSVSIFESRIPRGAVTPSGTTTTPTDTGPAQAPRPTSSSPATSSNPSSHRDRSKRSLGSSLARARRPSWWTAVGPAPCGSASIEHPSHRREPSA